MGNDFFWRGAHVLGERRIFFLGERAKRVKKKLEIEKKKETNGRKRRKRRKKRGEWGDDSGERR